MTLINFSAVTEILRSVLYKIFTERLSYKKFCLRLINDVAEQHKIEHFARIKAAIYELAAFNITKESKVQANNASSENHGYRDLKHVGDVALQFF